MFDWDEANLAHIARRGVLPHEAEEVILSNPLDISYVTHAMKKSGLNNSVRRFRVAF